MADALTAPFARPGARDAIAGGLVHIEQRVKSIELDRSPSTARHTLSTRVFARSKASPGFSTTAITFGEFETDGAVCEDAATG